MSHGGPLEVAIAGGGPVGCALALALAQAGRRVALIEPRAALPADGPLRPIALSWASRLILERLGAWAGLRSTAILEVDVSQAVAPGRTRFTAADAGLPALGDVVAYAPLAAALAARARAAVQASCFGESITAADVRADGVSLSLSSGATLEAACLVHAEGASAGMREKPYGQSALLAELALEPASRHCAWERFTPEGPLALLPFEGRAALVWGLASARAEALCAAAEADFLATAQAAFGTRAGRFVAVRERSCAPLVLRRRPRRARGREVFIGNAAQTLHPVAGQGLNLGLRDAWRLARALAGGADAGDPATLARYARSRALDAGAVVRVTDALATLFDGDNPATGLARGAVMLALDACAPARRFFARRMVFGTSAIP